MKHLLPIVLFALLLPLASAQEEEFVEIDFQVVSLDGTIRELFYITGKGERVPLLAYDSSRSYTYNYRGLPILRLFKDAEPKPETLAAGEVPPPVQVAQIDLSNAAKENLIILSPGPDGSYSAIILPDGSKSHPMGSYRFFNLTDSPVAISANDDPHLLKPKSEYLVEVFPEGSEETKCKIRVAIDEDQTWRRLYTNTWMGSANSRFLVIIMKTEDNKYSIRRIKDVAI